VRFSNRLAKLAQPFSPELLSDCTSDDFGNIGRKDVPGLRTNPGAADTRLQRREVRVYLFGLALFRQLRWQSFRLLSQLYVLVDSIVERGDRLRSGGVLSLRRSGVLTLRRS